jgi:hypothetical protein
MGTRPSSPAGYHRGRQRPPAVCTGRAEHRCRGDAPMQPARACRPSTVGDPPQHPDLGGACRCMAGGKLHVTPLACGLLLSQISRLTAAKPLSPPTARASTSGGSRHHGCTAPRRGARRIEPPDTRPARAQLRRTQRHPLAATGPPRRQC